MRFLLQALDTIRFLSTMTQPILCCGWSDSREMRLARAKNLGFIFYFVKRELKPIGEVAFDFGLGVDVIFIHSWSIF